MKKLNISRAKAIKGWMWPVELAWLARKSRSLSRIIEVGSYRGRSARAMLDNSDAHLWCVDTWNTPSDGKTGIISIKDFRAFKVNLKDEEARVNILKMRSARAAKILLELYGPCSFDMVFIDGGHSYGQVKADILAYTPLVKVGGIISGHDYGTWPGVAKAVRELVKGFSVVKSIWWATK